MRFCIFGGPVGRPKRCVFGQVACKGRQMDRSDAMLVRNAQLPDARESQDVLVIGERIAAIGAGLPAPDGAMVVEAHGQLLSPPFVDPHFHMDATLSHGLPRVNASGTLLEIGRAHV